MGLGAEIRHDETAVLFVHTMKLAYLDTPKQDNFTIFYLTTNALNGGFTGFFIFKLCPKLPIDWGG